MGDLSVADVLEIPEGPSIIAIERWESHSFVGYKIEVSGTSVSEDDELPMPRLIVADIARRPSGNTMFLLVAEKPYLSARPAGAALIKALRAAAAKARAS
jgi:hypothetical protein